jgi:hypothetical protein
MAQGTVQVTHTGTSRWRRRTGEYASLAAALEAAADEAERAGHYDRAVRLRFGAGLLRLAQARAFDLRPSSTVGEIVAALRSPPLGDLASTFEAIVYGGRRAVRADAESARRGWRTVLAGARRGGGHP